MVLCFKLRQRYVAEWSQHCASHYKLDRELSRLKDHFAEKYGYTAAARIREVNTFAMWLGIDFALNLNKATGPV